LFEFNSKGKATSVPCLNIYTILRQQQLSVEIIINMNSV